ncbi:MAG TPA: GDSL-type esterase/lipase family protein [Myxococcota bacterium]|nr:GDSL-type esterase/lipase family protein [Myxococcota bacterium]HNH49325.1 GDSL-type esterase/lipase family protein [Myxococcota bacterium]
MRWPRRLLFSLLPLLLLVLGAEGALRAMGWPKKDTGREFTHSEIYWVEDASLRKQAFPHKETGGSFRVSTDANGLRYPLHAEEKTAGTFRVMTLGCSTTFGWGVDDEASWPARLETILQEGGHKVEVVNGGQPGYSSFQGLWLWQQTLRRYQPDLVIFSYIVQDSRKVSYSDHSQAILQGNADFLKQNLLYRSLLYQWSLNQINGWRIESKDRAQTEFRVPLVEYKDNIRAMLKNTQDVGAKMMLFGFPLEREGYTGEHRRILHAAADVLELPIYDPQPEFERITSQQVLYFPQDRGHANAEGNNLIAQGMAQFLVAQKLVP